MLNVRDIDMAIKTPSTLRRAEIERIKAEASKHRAEEAHLIAQSRQLQKPFYQKQLFVQAIVAGFVAIPLIWFFVSTITVPLFQAEKVELKVKLAELKQSEQKQAELAESLGKRLKKSEIRDADLETDLKLSLKQLNDINDNLQNLRQQLEQASLNNGNNVEQLQTIAANFQFNIDSAAKEVAKIESAADQRISSLELITKIDDSDKTKPIEVSQPQPVTGYGSILERIAVSKDIEKSTVSSIVNMMFEEITETLKQGETVSFTNFGTFAVRTRSARTGRNPQTGETISISAAKVVSFKASARLKESVNEVIRD